LRRKNLRPPPRTLIQRRQDSIGIGKAEGRRAADSGIVYKFSLFKLRLRPLAVSAGNIPGRIPDAPVSA
jgi:hypothetical protein